MQYVLGVRLMLGCDLYSSKYGTCSLGHNSYHYSIVSLHGRVDWLIGLIEQQVNSELSLTIVIN